MEFLAKEISALRGAVAGVGSLVEVNCPSHFVAFTVCYTTYLYGLRANAEVISAYVHFLSHTAAYQFLKTIPLCGGR